MADKAFVFLLAGGLAGGYAVFNRGTNTTQRRTRSTPDPWEDRADALSVLGESSVSRQNTNVEPRLPSPSVRELTTKTVLISAELARISYVPVTQPPHANMRGTPVPIDVMLQQELMKAAARLPRSNPVLAAASQALDDTHVFFADDDMAIYSVPDGGAANVTLFGVLRGTACIRDAPQNIQHKGYAPRAELIVEKMFEALFHHGPCVTRVVYAGHSMGGFQANKAKNHHVEKAARVRTQRGVKVTAIIANAGGPRDFGSLAGTKVITVKGEVLIRLGKLLEDTDPTTAAKRFVGWLQKKPTKTTDLPPYLVPQHTDVWLPGTAGAGPFALHGIDEVCKQLVELATQEGTSQ